MTDRRFCDGCGEEMQRVNSDIEIKYCEVTVDDRDPTDWRVLSTVHLHGPGERRGCLLLWALKCTDVKRLQSDADRRQPDDRHRSPMEHTMTTKTFCDGCGGEILSTGPTPSDARYYRRVSSGPPSPGEQITSSADHLHAAPECLALWALRTYRLISWGGQSYATGGGMSVSANRAHGENLDRVEAELRERVSNA